MRPTDQDKHDRKARSGHPLVMVFYFISHLGRQALALVGLFLVIISVPVAIATPFLPIGLPIGVMGVALLGRNSVWGQRLLNHLLSKKPELERLAPEWLMKLVFGRPKQDKYRKAESEAGE